MNNRLQGRAERYQKGKALRARAPRELHSEFAVLPDRDAVAILADNDKDRLQGLLPERYRRMSEDAFSFFRGAAVVMAEDLARHPTAGAAVQDEFWRVQYARREYYVQRQRF